MRVWQEAIQCGSEERVLELLVSVAGGANSLG